MAKKSFKNNPAMQFISLSAESDTEKDVVAVEEKLQEIANKAATPAQEAPQKKPKAEGPPLKLNPMYVETRSKRVQLLMQPSLHARLCEMARAKGQSLNDLVHEVLEKLAEK